MKAAIISLGSVSSKLTAESMRKYFDQVDELNLKKIEISFTGKKQEILYEGKVLEDYDAIYAKGSYRFANLLSALTSLLWKESYMPINASAFNIAHDKLLSQLKMNSAKIPMPETFLASTIVDAKNILKKMSYPIIMKFPKGTQGKGVMFAESYASASSILDALSVLKQPVIIQEYIETSSTDIRAIVVGKEVVAAYRRLGCVEEKRANFHQGALGEPVELDDSVKATAVAAAKAIKAEICGVDILEGSKGHVVIEVNISPGLQGITKFTKIDVADKIAKFLYEKTKDRKTRTTDIKTKSLLMDMGIEDSTNNDECSEIIILPELRGTRLLLPEVITKKTKFNDKSEVTIKFSKGFLEIKDF
jgi:ribosomal protein S6--L-glutamate ligase